MTLDMMINHAASWLLTYAIHSTILILAVWLVVRGIPPLARRIGPRGENLAWRFALVGGLVSASVQVGAGVQPAFGAFELGQSEPVARAASEQRIGRMSPGHEEVIVIGGASPMFGSPPLASAPVPHVTSAAAPGPAPVPMWPKVLVGLALIGAALSLIRLGLCVRTLRRRLADRSEVLVDPALEQFLTLCRDAQINHKIRLTHTSALGSPIALARREIVLPTRALDELSPLALRSVLAHELAHLERRDPAWLMVAATIEALCFFQPLNRLARRGMQESAELLCDDWAIAQTGDGVQFAKSLAELAGWNHRLQPSALLSGMISGERPLVRRVRRALDGDPHRLEEEGPRPARLLFGLGALGALVMLAPGAVDASPPEAETKAEVRREVRVEKKVAREADQARERAERARAKAEKAREEASEAEREAREAERAAQQLDMPEGSSRGPSVMFRDGDDFLILDEQGIRAGDGRDRVEIDEKRIRIFHDGQQLDFDLDQLDFGGLEAFGIFEGLEDFGSEGLPSGQPGVLDPREFEGSVEELEELGGALEREMQIDLEQLDQLDELMNLGDLEQLMELGDVLRLFDGGPMQPPVPPGTPMPPGTHTPPGAPVSPGTPTTVL